ncbi:hypothetical protein AVZ29_02725 [Cronobacter sakazakii]|nr:hypothetical protein AVZ29_02725 [Cronobacter sakazakii]
MEFHRWTTRDAFWLYTYRRKMNMALLLPLFKVLIVITLLFGLWLFCGGSILFAFLSVLITGFILFRQHNAM